MNKQSQSKAFVKDIVKSFRELMDERLSKVEIFFLIVALFGIAGSFNHFFGVSGARILGSMFLFIGLLDVVDRKYWRKDETK